MIASSNDGLVLIDNNHGTTTNYATGDVFGPSDTRVAPSDTGDVSTEDVGVDSGTNTVEAVEDPIVIFSNEDGVVIVDKHHNTTIHYLVSKVFNTP